MARVILENLEKIYSEKTGPGVKAVNRINLTIEDKEFMVFVGPSGCGKSTTLRMIAGLEEISGGTVSIDDRIVNDVPPKDRDIAMVFQNYALYPHMTAYENMAFGLKLRKMPKDEIDRRVREASALLGLDPYLDRRPKSLSGGQRQRVAVGRAIVRKPKVFLFDEPLSNLDAKMRASTRTEISKLHASLDATMIYVTHDQVEAMTMGDRICVMQDGDIMQVAEPLELYNRPANLFVAAFIGSPPMNFFRGVVRRSGESWDFVEANDRGTPLTLAIPPHLVGDRSRLEGRPVTLGLRVEDVHEVTESTGSPVSTVAELTVEVAEPMGAETYVYLNTGANPLVARLRPTSEFKPGQTIRLTFDADKMHLFDTDSGHRL